jgi:hypothetical protein
MTVGAEFNAVGIFVVASVAVHSRNPLLTIAFQEKITDQRHAAVEGQPEQAFQQAGAAFEALVNGVRFGFFGGDHCADVFEEIDAAFFTFPAGALVVVAGRTFVTQCSVALGTEARHITRAGAAFGAFVGGCRFLCDGGWDRGRILHRLRCGGCWQWRGRWRDCDGARGVWRASARSRLPRDPLTAHDLILAVAVQAQVDDEGGCGGGVTCTTGQVMPCGELFAEARTRFAQEAGDQRQQEQHEEQIED